jgi:hypothetical protein
MENFQKTIFELIVASYESSDFTWKLLTVQQWFKIEENRLKSKCVLSYFGLIALSLASKSIDIWSKSKGATNDASYEWGIQFGLQQSHVDSRS